MQRAEICADRGAHHDVVKVGEVGVVNVDIDTKCRNHEPGEPSYREQQDESERIEHRCAELMRPLCRLTAQLNTLMAEGTATRNVSNENTSPE